MVKTKQRCNAKKNQNQRSLNAESCDEDDWILVKKQRVIIIIPPLPNNNSTGLGERLLQEKPRPTDNFKSSTKTNSLLQSPLVISASKQPINEPKNLTSFPEPAVQPPMPEPNLIFQNPSNLSRRIDSNNSPLYNHREITKGSQRNKMFVDSNAFLNQRMRMWYLDKKLKKAGGLENWLISLGLACFVKIFQMKRVNKFQLANITMQKLKDMGADAVGPRRKLMHAIDCVCEPHCFQNV